MTISYFIWNGSPEIFSFGSFALRWYGLLFALGFLISQQILYYIYKKEGKPQTDVDTLTIYMVIATVLGARLGHVIFYQPEMFLDNPLGIILPFEFTPEFRFTGLMGLASHGGAFGILFALWLYSRKKKPGQNYLQVLDRIVIVVAITGALIRFGNFFNSEIIGKYTSSPVGVVFASNLTESLLGTKNDNLLESIQIAKDDSLPVGAHGRMPINIYVFFKPNIKEDQARQFLTGELKYQLTRATTSKSPKNEFFDEPVATPLRVELLRDEVTKAYAARVKTFGIARHPAQLYESISCVFLFLFLFWLWSQKKEKTPNGRLFGWFMVILWSLRFSYEFLKENQEAFENNLTLNMGQILSIPLFIVGVWVLVRSYKNDSIENKEAIDSGKV